MWVVVQVFPMTEHKAYVNKHVTVMAPIVLFKLWVYKQNTKYPDHWEGERASYIDSLDSYCSDQSFSS